MTDKAISANHTINASPEHVFGVLADPTTHSAIDGTGWVLDPTESTLLTHRGQEFMVNMYAEQGPTGGAYRMNNTVSAYEPPNVIAWQPHLVEEDRERFGDIRGWEWRYDLKPNGEGTDVTLTYDWSGVPDEAADQIPFPPFDPSHLTNSLANLARIASRA